MPTTTEIVNQMRQNLAVSVPDLDTSVGTVARKILDAVGESIGEAYVDQWVLSYGYDIDSKTDADLDAFTQAVGGIARLAAKRATGLVVFSRTDTSTLVTIPVNAEVDSATDPSVAVQTIAGATMIIGQATVSVPVQAVNAGPEGNLAAGTLTIIASNGLDGVTGVTNLQPLNGGLAQETDDELRARWKATVFRSMAGTESMYLGTALNIPEVTAAKVIGASKRYSEQVQVSTGAAVSTVPDAAFVFDTGIFFGPNIDAGVLLLKDIDYTWDTSVNPPQVLINAGTTTYDTGEVDGGGNPIRATLEGAIMQLDFEYVPTTSRNDITNGILNRVDIWCAGQRPTVAKQSVVFKSAKRFTGTTTSPYYTGIFVRPDGTHPTSNNVFLPLAFGPIITVPDSLNVGGQTYGRIGASVVVDHADAYSVVHNDTAFGYAADSPFGLEWVASALPANNTVFTIGGVDGYVFDSVPRDVQDQIDRWRMVGTDAKAHAAKVVDLRFNLAIMYDRGANQATVNEAIDVAISTYLGTAGLGGTVQTSDIVQVVHNVSGVDNVRFLDANDYPSWSYGSRNTFGTGIQVIVAGAVATTYISTGGDVLDVVFADNQVPTLNNTVLAIKAQNTFRAA